MGLKLKSISILSWLCIVKAPIARNYPPPPPTISINCKCSLSLPTEVRNSVPSNSINFISNANNPIVIPRYSSLPFSHLLPSYIERLKIYDVYFDRYNWKIIPTFRQDFLFLSNYLFSARVQKLDNRADVKAYILHTHYSEQRSVQLNFFLTIKSCIFVLSMCQSCGGRWRWS